MQNYKLKQKIIKTKPATYYRGLHISSAQINIVKKLNKALTWQQVLQSRSLTLCKNTKCKHIARIKQIIKQQSWFYCIMQNAQSNLTQAIRGEIERKEIYKITRQLVELILGLQEENIVIRDIRPSHLFLTSNKNSLKLYHFETVSEKDLSELDLTELQDLRYIAPQEVLSKKGCSEKSLVFAVGLIICQLILGEPLLSAKNKLQYIYQLTRLFPSERIDQMKGSEHEFKQVEEGGTFLTRMHQQSQIGPSLVGLLERMLKIDHSERIGMGELLEATNSAIQNEEDFHKNKDQINRDANRLNLPNKNQVDIQSETINDIQFEFENKATLSSIPLIFTQKNKPVSSVLPHQDNVDDDGTQPIIIKQATSSTRDNRLNTNSAYKKGLIQKANQTPKISSSINQFATPKLSAITPIYSSQSPSQMRMHQLYGSDPSSKQIQMLKNSRSTKQTTLNTIKKPQLTNYALNEVNLGLKVAMNNTLFSDNNFEEEDFV